MGPWLIELTQREDLSSWLAPESPDPEKTIRMILRGDSPEMRSFIPRALDAAKEASDRIVIWVRNDQLLTEPEKAAFFDGGPDISGVVVSGTSIRCWIYSDGLDFEHAVTAFREAED